MPLAAKAISHDNTVGRLRAQWWAATVLCVLIFLGSYLGLVRGSPGLNTYQWMLQSLAVMTYVLGLLRYGLEWNHPPAKLNLRSSLGYGTCLTIMRGALIAVLAGYLFQPWPVSRFSPEASSWTPGLLYLAAAILDFADGRIARACRHETRLGAFLDINLDALGLLIAPLVGVWYGQLPAAYLSVGFAYYVYLSGIRLRKRFSKPVAAPGPWRGARIIAGVQMGFVGIALLPILKPPATTLAAYLLMIPLLAGFVRDWVIACGYRHAT